MIDRKIQNSFRIVLHMGQQGAGFESVVFFRGVNYDEGVSMLTIIRL